MEDGELQAIQLGALLHDVGKLAQRAGVRPPGGLAALSREDYGAHGAHALLSADFIQRQLAGRWALRPHDVLTHHLAIPPSRAGRIIALADRLAAGEREPDEGTGGAPPAWESQLLSILPRLATDGDHPPRDGFLPLAPLELRRETIFPRPDRLPLEERRTGYARLWQGLDGDFSRLPQEQFEPFLEAAFHLMQRYCWCVPAAAFRHTPDVSLFDHSRLTCAIAACLHLQAPDDHLLEALLAWPPRGEREAPLLLLVGGDISGLQAFLYTITAKGAAKTLRGRSFYLQLLAESAARFLLRRLGLSTPNVIYWGGGHFYLLAPISAATTLQEAAAEVEEMLLETHGGEPGLAIGWTPLAPVDFTGARFAEKWREVGAEISRAKGRRFGRVLRSRYHLLFSPSEGGGAGGRCAACHADLPGAPPGDEEGRCPTCQGMVELGQQIADAATSPGAILSVSAARPAGRLSRWQEALGRLGCWWDFGPGGHGALIYTINRTDFVPSGAHGFRWLPAVVPTRSDGAEPRVREMEDIASHSVGVERLGVLRMDMDGLGRLFASGLGGSATASRVATLSSSLRLFFEGWINRLCREVEASRKPPADGGLIYGVYSGGDDLFMVGPWDLMPILARRIRLDLGAFALENPAVTISAGIALVDAHLPVYQAARIAGKALEEGAKGFQRRDGPSKDAVTMLGETLGWEEFDALMARVDDLAALVTRGAMEGGLPRGLLSLLGSIHALYRREAAAQAGEQGVDRSRLYYGRWTWMAAYSLGRARERAKSEAARAALARIQGWASEPRGIYYLGLVARWAEYLTRSREVDRR